MCQAFSRTSASILLTLLLPGLLSPVAMARDDDFNALLIGELDYSRLQQGMRGRQTWTLNNLTDYVYQIERRCYCPAPSHAQVFVIDDRVVRVKDLKDGAFRTDPATLRAFKTIPRLFQEIDRILAATPDSVTLKLDRYLGYPALFSADPSYRMADEEVSYQISWLKPLVRKQ